MALFEVAVAYTAYEVYEVPATSPEQARRQVADPRRRARILAGHARGASNRDAGYGDDLEIIDVKEQT